MKQRKTYQRLPQRDMDIALQELLKRFLEDYSRGIFQIGQILPSPRALAGEYNVTFSTARNLYTKLAQKGFVKSIPRKGTMLCCVPDMESWGPKDLLRNGLTTIGVLDYVNPNAILNLTMTQLHTIDELCNQNKILSRFYNLHKQFDQILTTDPIDITNEDISALKKQHSVGYIFLSSQQICHKENWKQLKKLNAPVVIVNAAPPIPGFCTIRGDEIESGTIATEYQLKLKHQKIAFLGYDFPADWQDQRISGYRLAMEKQNLRPIERWSHFFPYHNPENIMDDSKEAVFQEAEKIMKTCTAAVCASDALAALMLQYAYEHKIKPISLVSFDNDWRFRSWELTSVQYPFSEIATAAFQQILMMQKKNDNEPVNQKIPGVLYKRLSTNKWEDGK